jgi:hypothetical protein
MNQPNDASGNLPTDYDRMISGFEGLPDVTKTSPATVRTITPLIGKSQTFIIQTIRQQSTGDHVFLEIVSDAGAIRVMLPPKAADTIARQRAALSTKVRSKHAKRVMADRIARGEDIGKGLRAARAARGKKASKKR